MPVYALFLETLPHDLDARLGDIPGERPSNGDDAVGDEVADRR